MQYVCPSHVFAFTLYWEVQNNQGIASVLADHELSSNQFFLQMNIIKSLVAFAPSGKLRLKGGSSWFLHLKVPRQISWSRICFVVALFLYFPAFACFILLRPPNQAAHFSRSLQLYIASAWQSFLDVASKWRAEWVRLGYLSSGVHPCFQNALGSTQTPAVLNHRGAVSNHIRILSTWSFD